MLIAYLLLHRKEFNMNVDDEKILEDIKNGKGLSPLDEDTFLHMDGNAIERRDGLTVLKYSDTSSKKDD